ncbi:MAG: MFS transporter [Lachnospiraceae bacterium]|nr:MFS transporter [Lachnospiraceae bacterium]
MKTESAEKAAKRHEKEARELERLTKASLRKPLVHGFWFLLVILTVIYIADEISSNMNGVMKPYMIFDLFKIPGQDTTSDAYGSAISVMAIATIPTYILTAVNPLYRTLADRFGRKLFLFLNTLFMGIGMLICMTAANPYIFVVGTCITGFFTPNDMQVIYLMETAPKEHRAKLCSITKGIGLLSVSLIGVLRSIFYNPDELSTWRLVYLVPVILTIAIAVIAFLCTKETPVFLGRRISYLKKTDEERAAEQSKAGGERGTIGEAVRYIIHSRQLRMIAIVLFIFSMAISMSGYSSEILLAGGHMNNDDMNLFYIIEPLVYAVFAFFSGFFTDKLGRKNSGVLFGICAIIGHALFVFGAKWGIGAVALAFANGFMFGGLWSLSDLLFLVLPGESAPTRIRASVMAVISYMYLSNILVSMLVGIFYGKIGSAKIGVFELCFFVPIILFSIIFLKLKVKETKDTDLNTVGEE